jgi:hypothetical protein
MNRLKLCLPILKMPNQSSQSTALDPDHKPDPDDACLVSEVAPRRGRCALLARRLSGYDAVVRGLEMARHRSPSESHGHSPQQRRRGRRGPAFR